MGLRELALKWSFAQAVRVQARLIGLRLLYQRTASPLVLHEAAPPHLHALGTDVVLDCKGDPR